jgi:elongation factor P
MDTETYEQPGFSREQVEHIIPYLTENLTVKISSYNSEALDIEIPLTVDLKVIETEPGFAGDTAQGATKPARVSTGLVVQTPLFVNEGDVIRIDTRTGQYITRV